MVPASQKSRQIGFHLEGGGPPAVDYDFYIRPEELTRHEISRLTVQQTLGGAWADDFGRGVGVIRLEGHTGWRGSPAADGEALFQGLRKTVFTDWHVRRRSAMALGQDASTVQLYFVDTLDQISSIVAPQEFTLRRSKSNPLLLRFHIELVELGDATLKQSAADPITAGMTNPLRWMSSITGINLGNSALGKLSGELGGALSSVESTVSGITRTAQGYISAASGMFNKVVSIAQTTAGQFEGTVAPILSAGLSVANAGRNAFGALAATGGMLMSDKCIIMNIAAAFNSIWCAMRNGFGIGNSFNSFDGLYGASNCSSTAGGRPASGFTAAGINPFGSIFPAASNMLNIGITGSNALSALSGDAIALVNAPAEIAGNLSAVSSALSVL